MIKRQKIITRTRAGPRPGLCLSHRDMHYDNTLQLVEHRLYL